MKSLLIRPIQYSNESPGGLLLRASDQNGWVSPYTLLSAYDFDTSYCDRQLIAIMSNKNKWAYACEKLGLNPSLSQASCYHRVGVTKRSRINFMGLSIPWGHLRLGDPAVCSQCLKSNSYLPMQWDHSFITSCTKHHIQLMHTCPGCGENIRWGRKNITTCSCGYNLSDAKPSNVDTTSVRFFESIIKRNDIDAYEEFADMHASLEAYFRNLDKQHDLYDLTSLTHLALTDTHTVINLLSERTIQATKVYGLHPRLLLSPLLSARHKHTINLAGQILSTISELKYRITKTEILREQYTGLNACARTLGISPHLVKKLINSDIIKAMQGKNTSAIRISKSSVNQLLIQLSKGIKPRKSFKSIDTVILNPSCNTNFVSILKRLLSGDIRYSSMQLAEGLMSTQIEVAQDHLTSRPSKYLTLRNIAEQCDVHYENIRFAVHAGILPRVSPELTKGTTIFIKPAEAHRFTSRFIFAGKLARDHNCNASNIAEKIMATGIQPVSGPGIDGGLTFLFRTKDIKKADIKNIINMKNYPTKAGRKKGNLVIPKSDLVPLSSASSKLGVSIQTVARLVRKGLLTQTSSNKRDRFITRESLESIEKYLSDNSIMPVAEAAKVTRESIHEFRQRWIETGHVQEIDIDIQRYISRADLRSIERFKSKYITSQEVGQLTGSHRSHVTNLQKMNMIKPAKVLHSRGRVINFYCKEDISALYQ